MIAKDMSANGGSSSERALHRVISDSSPLLPQSQPVGQPLSSAARTFVNIIISVVGASVLGLPYAFKRAGWLAGILTMALAGLASYYCMRLLVWSKYRLEREGNLIIISYGDLGFHTFGKLGRAAVDTLVVMSQASFCVGYLIFIGETLASIFSESDFLTTNIFNSLSNHHFDPRPVSSLENEQLASFAGLSWNSKPVYVWIVFPFEVALATIRSVTHLAPFSLFADVADVVGMGLVMVKDVLKLRGASQNVEAFRSLANLPFTVGVGVYAFEGISMVFPLETAMAQKSQFGRVLGLAFLLITCLYSSFGVLGYLAYGENTKQIITLNLGKSSETEAIQLALCAGLFFTFPLMMNPVYEILERRFTNKKPSIGLRALVVLITSIVAVAVPNFSSYLSLVGSSICCLLGFIFPAAMHLKAHWGDPGKYLRSQAVLNYIVIVFGLLFGVTGTITSLQDTF